MQSNLRLWPPPDADAELTLRTMAELLTATDRLRLDAPQDGAAEVVEVLYAVRDILDGLGAETSRLAAYLTSVGDPARDVGSRAPGIDMVRLLNEALLTASLLAGQAAATVSNTINAEAPHDD